MNHRVKIKEKYKMNLDFKRKELIASKDLTLELEAEIAILEEIVE